MSFTDGREVRLPLDYVADHLRHAYARTVHKTQGLTCEAALLLGDDAMYAELGYTAITRGTNENRIYTVVTAQDFADRDFHLEHLVRSSVQLIINTVMFDTLLAEVAVSLNELRTSILG